MPALLGAGAHLVVRMLVAIAGLLLLLVVFTLFVLGTAPGSAWVAGAVTDFSGGKVKLTGVSGTLLAGLHAGQAEVTAGHTRVLVGAAEVRVNWPDLLRRRLRLTTARTDAVTVELLPRPADEPDTPVAPLKLPFTIAVDRLEVGRLSIHGRANGDGGSQAPLVELGPIALKGDLAGGVIRFDRLQVHAYGVNVEAAGRFGTGEPFALAGQLRWRIPAAEVSGAGNVAGDLGNLQFGQAIQLPSTVQATGRLHLLDGEPRIDAVATWRDLHYPLDADDFRFDLHSSSGRLGVQGSVDDYSIRLDSRVAFGAGPVAAKDAGQPAAIAIVARGNLDHMDLTQLDVAGFGGSMRGTGRVQLTGTRAVRLELRGQGINPGFVDPRFDGQLDFGVALSADAEGRFRLQVPKASGRLFSRPVALGGTLIRDPQVLVLEHVRVASGVNRVAVDGRWGPRVSGTFTIDAPELATLWPGLEGGLAGSGSASGTSAAPRLHLELDGRQVGYDALKAATLRIRGTTDRRGRQSVSLVAAGLHWDGSPLGSLSVELDGAPESHDIHATLAGGDVGLELMAAGSWRAGALTERIESARATVGDALAWSLEEPTTVRVAGSDLAVSAHCWGGSSGSLCVTDSRFDGSSIKAGLALHEFPLAVFSPWLPADLKIGGTATASLSLGGKVGRYTGQLHGSLGDAVLEWRTEDDEEVRTAFSEFIVNADLTDATLAFDGRLAETFGLHLDARGFVTAPFSESPAINANITGGVPDLASLGPVLERFVDIADPKGRLNVDVSLSGNARQPDLSGGIELDEGAFTVPVAGITVDRITLALRGRPDGRLALEGNARSGKGFVVLAGSLAWRDQLLPTGEATIKGRLIDVIRLPEGMVQVSPDVQVRLRDGQFRVGGDLLVPRAEIRLKELKDSGVEPSPDTVVHGRVTVVAESRPPLFVLDGLRVRLGEQVSFDGFGLKTRLQGGLVLSQSLGAEPGLVSGTGVVALKDGQFTAFGQKLAIDHGSLIFSGEVTNPGLDVKASRSLTYQGREVTVGVLLSGNLERINTRLYSDPAMGELDALSYLTTGKPLSSSSVGDRSMVSNAAISLGLRQALPLAQELGSALNVDEIGLDSTDSGDTAVVVGERLGKDLFIRYSYGVFDQIGTIKVTYRLAEGLSLEASSGNAQSLDLIYSVTW